MRIKIIEQQGRVGRGSWFLLDQIGFYTRLCRRQSMDHWQLFVFDGLGSGSRQRQHQKFHGPDQVLFRQMLPLPLTRSFVGLGLSFIASYGDAVLLDGLKNSCLSVIFQETACPA